MKNLVIAILSAALLVSAYFHLQKPAALPLEQNPAASAPEPVVHIPASPPEPVPPPPEPENRYEMLRRLIREAQATPGLEGAAVGFCLLGPDGAILMEENARTAQIPASTLKTVTTATALQRFGPEYRFRTKLLATGEVTGGILAGDVVIQGGGDPRLSLADLEKWATELQGRGIKQIRGRILGDGRFFEGSLFDDFWNWGDLGNGYGSPVCGLNLEHNRYTATLLPGAAVGDPAVLVSALPVLPGVKMINEVRTAAAGSGDGVVIYGGERTPMVTLRGTVPLGQGPTEVLGAVTDPEAFAAHHFREILLKAGITVSEPAASIREAKLTDLLPNPLLTHDSPPLLEIITSIHAVSDNHETECLFRILGLAAGQPPVDVIRSHWKAAGLDFVGLRMEDGSGLARASHIRPLDLAKLQHLALNGPHGDAYAASLLSNNNIRWKGGAMSSIRSTAGYLTDRSGIVYSFALMLNHYTDKTAATDLRQRIIETVCGW